MATKRVKALVCNLCGNVEIDNDLETLGLRINRAFYAGLSGGGPVPDAFICESCIRGDEDDAATVEDIIKLVWDNPHGE